MFGSVRRVRLAALSLLLTTAGIAAIGCATGTTTDEAGLLPDGPADASTDTRPTKGRTDAADAESSSEPGDEDDDDAGDSLPVDGGTDASVKDASGVKSDAGDAGGKDAAAQTDGGSDGGTDGAVDAGSDPEADAGTESDSGTAATKPAQGEVVISEVMYNPLGTEPDAEWIEVYNTASGPRLLSGLVIRDGSNRSHKILPGVTVAPGAYVVLASVRAAVVASGVPDAVIVYEYNAGAATAVQLANGSGGEVVLLDGANEVARSHYGTIGMSSSANGQSIQLRVLDYASAGAKANWCYSPTAWAPGTGKGTPGAASNCP